MEAMTAPDFIEAAEADMEEFLESIGVTEPVGDDHTDVEIRIDWLMQLIAERREAMRRNDDVAHARITMIQNWWDDENEAQARQIEWLEYKIREHAPRSSEATEDTYGKKSRTLPHGTFGFRRTPDSVEVTDKVAAVDFAQANDLAVRVERTVSKTTLKNHARETGECEGPGWQLREGGDVFYVKV